MITSVPALPFFVEIIFSYFWLQLCMVLVKLPIPEICFENLFHLAKLRSRWALVVVLVFRYLSDRLNCSCGTLSLMAL